MSLWVKGVTSTVRPVNSQEMNTPPGAAAGTQVWAGVWREGRCPYGAGSSFTDHGGFVSLESSLVSTGSSRVSRPGSALDPDSDTRQTRETTAGSSQSTLSTPTAQGPRPEAAPGEQRASMPSAIRAAVTGLEPLPNGARERWKRLEKATRPVRPPFTHPHPDCTVLSKHRHLRGVSLWVPVMESLQN